MTARAAFAPAPASGATPAAPRPSSRAPASLRLEDEGALVSLQHAYGYYVDKNCGTTSPSWFVDDATMELDHRGVYVGPARIRRAIELFGPSGMKTGELNDRVQLQPLVTVSPAGARAMIRVSELRMTGMNGSASECGQAIFENEYLRTTASGRSPRCGSSDACARLRQGAAGGAAARGPERHAAARPPVVDRNSRRIRR